MDEKDFLIASTLTHINFSFLLAETNTGSEQESCTGFHIVKCHPKQETTKRLRGMYVGSIKHSPIWRIVRFQYLVKLVPCRH